MKKKDYELIAQTLKQQQPKRELGKQYNVWYEICRGLAIALNTTSHSFDIQKFLTACGINYKTVNGVLETGTQAYL